MNQEEGIKGIRVDRGSYVTIHGFMGHGWVGSFLLLVRSRAGPGSQELDSVLIRAFDWSD